VFGLDSLAYWKDAAKFCSLREKRFSLENDVAGGRDISQNVQACLTDPTTHSVIF